MIVSFDSPGTATLDQTGGKALSLMTLLRAGLPVPPGFVLTVRFFEPWLTSILSSAEWAAVSGGPPADGRPYDDLREFAGGLPFTGEQRDELDQALADWAAAGRAPLFAVRSSSPDEDLEAASFAGGYETTLGATGDALDAAIRRSFASAFDERVFVYRREHRIPTVRTAMAVIVQQLVPATSAGVAFSINPLNNCYDEAVIDANFGLGESVVSGAVTPDAYVIHKPTRAVLETRIGSRDVVIRANAGGGTVRAPAPAGRSPVLTPAQAVGIVDLLAAVEGHYQKPVDIEWAFEGEHLRLLQARPITTYLPLPDEMVTAPGEPKHLYANSTLIEQGVEEPLSVLGADFLSYVLQQVGGAVAAGATGPGGMTFTAGGGYYMDLSYAQKLRMGRAALAPGSFGDPRVMAILDGIDMTEYLAMELPPKLKALRGKMLFSAAPMGAGVIHAYLRPDYVLRRYQAALPGQVRRLKEFSGEGQSLEQQAVRLTEMLQFFYGDHGIPMILAAQAAQERMRMLFRQEAAAAQDHLVNLGVALPGNKTTEMGELMYALARSPELRLAETAREFLAALEQDQLPAEFTDRWRRFVAEFGMRCPGEIDAATPRPWEHPEALFDQLKTMALSAVTLEDAGALFEQARTKREAAYEALHRLALKQGKRQAGAFEKYYRVWLTFGGYRETPKHYVIKVIDLFRRQALADGRAFVAEGRLDRAEDIFDLTIADIDRARSDGALDLRRLGKERRALIDQIRRSRLVARVIDSRGKIYYPPRAESTPGELAGVPISPGVASGRVKVLHHAREKPVLPGEILVARVTDPGWTPLFINAAGIVLEIGGALQHGAVVAREYGIPCVSGVDDATSRLQDGQLVEVDGSHGIVRVVA